ncbi:hypothetical protein [Streptomyces kronopolitis]|uniref:hypothetical protein n=1 Tax=Streptomyces kronopolitis TaxID=1612435 RepID=UPI003D991B30
MSRRPTQDPKIDPERGGEIHPAFGVAVVTRSSGSGRLLFQSDLLHNETILLSVREATRKRDLNHDWVHSGRELVEIEMSLAQWGSLVSSMGLGSGVPVTIRRTEHDAFVPEIPHQPRTAESLREVREVTDRMYARVKAATAALHEAIHEKKGVRATKEALRALENAVAHVGSNAQFARRLAGGGRRAGCRPGLRRHRGPRPGGCPADGCRALHRNLVIRCPGATGTSYQPRGAH